MAHILLIDDSDEIGPLVVTGLTPHSVDQVRTVVEVESALKQAAYDVFLIDVSLPDGNGFDVCLRLSHDARHKKTPRILLTSKDQTSEKVYGFNCGADDYITKPFNLVELKARVDRYLRRQAEVAGNDGVFVHSCFVFNLGFQQCQVDHDGEKTDLHLTPTEFRLFLTLAKNEGQVLTRKTLESMAWESQGTAIETRGIDTHIAHLRRKLGPLKDVIISVYGQGYSFKTAHLKSQAA